MSISIVLPSDLDNLDLPYIISSRPKISWFEESILKVRSFKNVELNIKKIENVEEQDLKILRNLYTEVHSEDLYISAKSRQYFKKYMSIIYSQVYSILNSDTNIVLSIAYPPDLWAGRTFLRKCSIFSLTTYIAKKLNGKTCIVSLDVHYGIGIHDEVMYERDLGREIFFISICSMSDIDTKIYRRIKKNPWKVLPIIIPPGSRDDILIPTLDYAFRIVQRYNPEVLIFLLGLDIYREDLIGEFMISCDAIYDVGKMLSMLLQSIYIKKLIILIECVSSKKSIEKAFSNFLAGLLNIEKPYYDPISKESSSEIKKMTYEGLVKIGKMLYKFWKVRPGIKIPKML